MNLIYAPEQCCWINIIIHILTVEKTESQNDNYLAVQFYFPEGLPLFDFSFSKFEEKKKCEQSKYQNQTQDMSDMWNYETRNLKQYV